MIAGLTLILAAALEQSSGTPSAAAAGAEPISAAEQAERRQAEEIFGEMLTEDGNISVHGPDYRGHLRLSVQTRSRASQAHGTCVSDVLRVERAEPDATAPGSSAIRSFETIHNFYILRDENAQPLWDVANSELEQRCAAIPADDGDWFEADDASTARAAVAGLLALRDELRKANPRRVAFACRRGGCPSAANLVERIEPLSPLGAWRDHDDCDSGASCVRTLINNPGCGAWSTQLRMDGVETDRFKSARIGDFVGALHCGEQDM